MSDQPDNLVLVYLRRLTEGQARIENELSDLKVRVSIIGNNIADMKTELAGLHRSYATTHSPLDRIDNRLDRIERRLDLHDERV